VKPDDHVYVHKLILQLIDVISEDKPVDQANTCETLPMHNDLVCFESPPYHGTEQLKSLMQ